MIRPWGGSVVAGAGVGLLFVAACSKSDPPRPSPSVPTNLTDAEAEIEEMKKLVLANFSKTCEGAALAAVQSTSDGRATGNTCTTWRVHGKAPSGAPSELLKTSVLVWCESPRAHYVVRLAGGDVLSLREPSKPEKLDVERGAAATAAQACEHIYD
jgi:hypothetical protein